MPRDLPNSQAPIPPVKLAHIVIRTPRLAEMRAFYTKVLGARVVSENHMSVGLTFDLEHHRLAFIAVPMPAEVESGGKRPLGEMLKGVDMDFGDQGFDPTPGIEHIAFTFASLADLLATYQRLKQEGLDPMFCVNHGLTTSMYYRDPDGNKAELQVDNMTMDQADEFMTSEAFMQNPVGIPFNPEDLVKLYKSNVPLREVAMNGWDRAAIEKPVAQPVNA